MDTQNMTHTPDSPAQKASVLPSVPASVMPEPKAAAVTESTPAPQPTEDNPGFVRFRLHRPLKVDGKEIAELVLDFDGLGGEVMENVDDQIRADGKATPRSVVWSTTYCLYLGARAAKLHINDVRRLSFKDQARVVTAVQAFFTNMAE